MKKIKTWYQKSSIFVKFMKMFETILWMFYDFLNILNEKIKNRITSINIYYLFNYHHIGRDYYYDLV